MLEYAPMLHVSYYAKNYASIIRQGLNTVKRSSQGVYVRSENGEKSVGVKLKNIICIIRAYFCDSPS